MEIEMSAPDTDSLNQLKSLPATSTSNLNSPFASTEATPISSASPPSPSLAATPSSNLQDADLKPSPLPLDSTSTTTTTTTFSPSAAASASSLRTSPSHRFHSTSSFPSTSFPHALDLYLRSYPRFFSFLFSKLSDLFHSPSPPFTSSSPFSSLFVHPSALLISCSLLVLTYVCVPVLFLRTKEAWMSLVLVGFSTSLGHFVWFEKEKEKRNGRVGVARLVGRRRPPQKREWLKFLPIVMLGSFTLFLMTSHTTNPNLAYHHSTWMNPIFSLSHWFPFIASTFGPTVFWFWINFLLLPLNLLSLSIYSLLFHYNFDTSHSVLEYFPFLTAIPYLSAFVSDSRPSSPALSPARSLSSLSSPRVGSSQLGHSARLSSPAAIRRDAKLMSMRSAISNSLVGGAGGAGETPVGTGPSAEGGMNKELETESEKENRDMDWQGERSEDESERKADVSRESDLSREKLDFISDKAKRVLGFAEQFESNTDIREGFRRRNSVDSPSLSFGSNKSNTENGIKNRRKSFDPELIGIIKPQSPKPGDIDDSDRSDSQIIRTSFDPIGGMSLDNSKNENCKETDVANDEFLSKGMNKEVSPRYEYQSAASQLLTATTQDGLKDTERERENDASSKVDKQQESQSHPLRSPSPVRDSQLNSSQQEIDSQLSQWHPGVDMDLHWCEHAH